MKIPRRIQAWFRRERIDAEMAEEMRHHLALQAERNRAAGLDAAEAGFAAQRQFGNLASIQERVRSARAGAGWESWWKDARFAGRSLRRAPFFSLVVTAILALGVGAVTTIYAVAHALLWTPLRYRAPEELTTIRSVHPRSQVTDLAPGTFGDLEKCHSFSAVGAHYYYYVNLTGAGDAALLNSAEVTRDYFRLFGVAPWRGRLWDPADPAFNAAPVVVLSYDLWRSRFGGRDAIVGEQILLDEVPHTVIAVMPPGFKEPAETVRFWRPMRPGADNPTARDWRYWTVFARLAPGVSLTQANDELAAVAQRQAGDDARNYAGWSLQAFDLRETVVHDHRPGLLLMLGGVGCLVVITIANVAGLSLVRATARGGELAVREALGATRGQLVRLLLLESCWLALAGGAAGLLLARWGLAGFARLIPDEWLPRMDEVALNVPVLALAGALTAGAGLAAGLIPAWPALGGRVGDALKGAQRSIAGPGSRRLRAGLVVGQLAFTMLLLSAAGVLGRSYASLVRRPSGVDGDRVLTATVALSAKRYDTPAKDWEYFSRAQAALAAIPGVECVGLTQTVPFRWGIPVEFKPVAATAGGEGGEMPAAFTDSVSVDYFRAVGISLRSGRLFTADDDYRRGPMLILSETAARQYFGGEPAVGRFLTLGPGGRFEVVGVVSDVRRAGLNAPIPLQAYRPMAQRTPAFAAFMVRTRLDPAALTAIVRAALREIDPAIPVTETAPLAEFARRSIAQPRLHFTLFAAFAASALLLAAIGLYGLIAYTVLQRDREFAVRSALGAGEGAIFRLVLTEGVRLTAWGLLAGTGAVLLGAGLLHRLVYDIPVRDPVSLLAGSTLVVVTAILACWLPARRAAKIDPAVALRGD